MYPSSVIRALVFVGISVTLIGCNTKAKLIGVWNGTLSGHGVRIEFKSDGKYVSTIAPERDGGVTSAGTFKVDGNSVTLHPETITNSSGTVPAGDVSLGRDMRYSLTWHGEKSMKMANMRDSMELQKE